MMTTLIRLGLAALMIWLTGCQGGRETSVPTRAAADEAAIRPPVEARAKQWRDYQRDVEYAEVVRNNVLLTMRDGTRLAATISRPAGSDGAVVDQPLPVVMTFTAYNAGLSQTIFNADYFVQRGYVHVYVDERGTGSSEGTWSSFGEAAQADFGEVLEWTAEQDFCDGNIGTYGPSYMAITQFFAAHHAHPAHKAMFAIVPMADAYRDIFLTGGQVNAGFIPLWGGLVGGLAALPVVSLMEDPEVGLNALLDHVTGSLLTFAVPEIAGAVLGGANQYDGPFWRIRSPIEFAQDLRIPTFIVGGNNDLFQRGQPLLYEAMRNNAPTKLLMGPWTHLEGSFGEGLPTQGIPSMDAIALQWFDRYLKGQRNGMEDQPDVTQYVYGAEEYRTSNNWPHPRLRPRRLYLQAGGALDPQPPSDAGRDLVLQQPINGLCSMSASQWTAGVIGLLPLPCASDNRITELLEVTYSTSPLDEPLYVNGPIQANVWISTTALDAGLVVRITDVAPNGQSREITNGILTASKRAVDLRRGRRVGGVSLQPWHPFTADSELPVIPGEAMLMQVEVFPSSFEIAAGHRLRVSVGASDLPHGLPPLPDLLSGVVGLLSVHSGPEQPSHVVLPVVPR